MESFCKKGALKNFSELAKFTRKHLFSKNRPEAYNIIKKKTPTHVFSCEF